MAIPEIGGSDLDAEEEFKRKLRDVLSRAIANFSLRFGEDKVLDHLGDALRASEDDVVKLVVPRAVNKWAPPTVAEKLNALIDGDPKAIQAIRAVGVSIANTLRPIAGNRFAELVHMKIEGPLNEAGIGCVTKGKIKSDLNKLFKRAQEEIEETEDGGGLEFKPDLDIVCYDKEKQKAFLIISCKTSFAERLMQTVSWSRYIALLRPKLDLSIYVVTAWEDLNNITQRARARMLDGAYKASFDVIEDEKVKRLSRIVPDIIALRNRTFGVGER